MSVLLTRSLLAEELANNRPMMAAVAAFARAEGVVYAEYAGLIYLSQSVQPVGALPVSMGARRHPTELFHGAADTARAALDWKSLWTRAHTSWTQGGAHQYSEAPSSGHARYMERARRGSITG